MINDSRQMPIKNTTKPPSAYRQPTMCEAAMSSSVGSHLCPLMSGISGIKPNGLNGLLGSYIFMLMSSINY